jgi:hypothetical protein
MRMQHVRDNRNSSGSLKRILRNQDVQFVLILIIFALIMASWYGKNGH